MQFGNVLNMEQRAGYILIRMKNGLNLDYEELM